jgi:GAF domain-containing protein
LLNELRESLQQQTATSEVLKVISSSPGELQPVFRAMLDHATRICQANFGFMFRYDKAFRPEAMQNVPDDLAAFVRERGSFQPRPDSVLDLVLRTKEVAYTDDDTAGPSPASPARLGGARSTIAVPMLKDDKLVGAIVIYRTEVRPFTEKQIELVSNFAAQAVIAIENTRLLNELRESLQQQTASADVLRVINSSPGELSRVFSAMLENATRICDAQFGDLWLCEADGFRFAAVHGAPPAYSEMRRREPLIYPSPKTGLVRAKNSRNVVQITDAKAEPIYAEHEPARVALVDLAGARTLVVVPMLKDDAVVGCISVYRQEVRPFTDKQVELLRNFGAQAVIAIENTRLLNELRESLQQQTATADVLTVISSSPGDLKPVFQAMLQNSVRICEANFGQMFLCVGDAMRVVAQLGVPAALSDFIEGRGLFQPSVGSGLRRALDTKQVIHIDDVASENASMAPARLGGARSYIAVPMLREAELVGVIVIYRQEVRPFTDKQISFVTNFAAQAVIAIENARLLSELRESLQQQTATADVLKVISHSTFNLQTVLDTLTQSACRLCRADRGSIRIMRDATYHSMALHGYAPEHAEYMKSHPTKAERSSLAGRVVLARQPVQIADVRTDPELTLARAAPDFALVRTLLGVPLLREDQPVGVFILSRERVEPFSDKQIELLTTFADQAVIAIENVRLFEDVQKRTQELSESLEDLRTAQDRLVQTQKLASLGQLTAGIAHEIKNPLNFVNNFSSLSTELLDELQETLRDAPLNEKIRAEINELTDTLRANLDKIEQHGKRADSIVKNMLLHSREGSGEHRPVDINALVEESLNLAYHGARAEKQGFNITLEQSFDPAAGEVDVFPQDITRVLLNLISNGFYAATKRKTETNGGDYEPTLAAATKNLGDRVEIRIRDNGTGIPPEVKEKIFNPFFTTKPAGEGTGLGLSLSHDIIVKQHAGSIDVETVLGEFTEFRIILPRAAATVAKSGGRA